MWLGLGLAYTCGLSRHKQTGRKRSQSGQLCVHERKSSDLDWAPLAHGIESNMKTEMWIVSTLVISLSVFVDVQNASACLGRIFNPVTDVDWMGVFPIKIGGITVASFGGEDTETVGTSPICFCSDRPPPLNVLPGIPVSFWRKGGQRTISPYRY